MDILSITYADLFDDDDLPSDSNDIPVSDFIPGSEWKGTGYVIFCSDKYADIIGTNKAAYKILHVIKGDRVRFTYVEAYEKITGSKYAELVDEGSAPTPESTANYLTDWVRIAWPMIVESRFKADVIISRMKAVEGIHEE